MEIRDLKYIFFICRYLEDFDHLQYLGKGGYGIVFKAKKKIDNREYAIKRISVSGCEKTSKIREVIGLANLEHPHIVRYFHGWWEAPPDGWQRATDKELFLGGRPDTSSYVASTDSALETNSKIQFFCLKFEMIVI